MNDCREKKEAAERALRGEPELQEDDGKDKIDGDPFKRIDPSKLGVSVSYFFSSSLGVVRFRFLLIIEQ